MIGYLILEDSTIYKGNVFGYLEETVGEIVFNTGMTGYQEVLTDPSYYGQIVTMTYPLIGNYGVNIDDNESKKSHVKGFIVREYCEFPSNFRVSDTIDEYLKKNKILGLAGIDTRSLTKRLREQGTMKGSIVLEKDYDIEKVLSSIKAYTFNDAVKKVTRENIEIFNEKGEKTVALLDYGVKNNIVNNLTSRGCKVVVFPATSTAQEIMSYKPDGIMLSNGPGDPKDCDFEIKQIKELINKLPMFAICLGHQLVALALGGNTVKLKYGHRGCNHPVREIASGRTYITSQNHGYCVEEDSLGKDIAKITHINNNDNTVEGIEYINHNVFSVQFHPEANPGPRDTEYLFNTFIDKIDNFNVRRI